jgi:hypothetical protein
MFVHAGHAGSPTLRHSLGMLHSERLDHRPSQQEAPLLAIETVQIADR